MSTDHHSESGAGAPTSAAATRTLGDRLRRYALEALVGCVVAGVLMWTAIASDISIPFIYQGH